ncbi:hypothetical protein BpHYR1_012111 [Brachionus plicatilis]|uniref:Interleukin 17-like protein n=1 Tax=Brachionus plicatilis TaxID=10195 RepID=A0A3M7SVI9_BRAPC|nr:hypothetical protein BpHYR1_012111 [Brachionus plicatilis]
MFKFNVINLFYLVNFVFGQNENCINPTIQELETKFQQYRFDYLRFEQAMLKAGKLLEFDLKENKSFSNDQSCSSNEKFIYNEDKLCHSRIKIEYQRDRYPNYKLNVQCDCKLCSTMKNGVINPNYECQPVHKRVSILKKDKCANDGYYQWIPTTELLNTGCLCGINRILIPV